MGGGRGTPDTGRLEVLTAMLREEDISLINLSTDSSGSTFGGEEWLLSLLKNGEVSLATGEECLLFLLE